MVLSQLVVKNIMERKLPDPSCASICRHALTDRCIETCNPNGEMELLEVREDLTVDRMPAYRVREDLNWKARFRLQEAYTQKLVDQAQGVVNEPIRVRYSHHRRQSVPVDISNKDVFVSTED